MTKTERLSRAHTHRFIFEENFEDHEMEAALADKVPAHWHLVEPHFAVREKKVKVTLLVDQSVAEIFRAMGTGYQARINRILALWMNMKLFGQLRPQHAMYQAISHNAQVRRARRKG